MKDKNTPMPSEHALLETCFREESANMVRFAARELDNFGLAEVAVQDCFLHALEHEEEFAASPKPTGWLYEALKHIIQHAFRDRQTYLKHIVQINEMQPEIPQYDQYSMGLLDDGDDPDIRLLAQLYLGGYPLRDLAEHYQKSVGATKMWVKRAKERVRRRL